MPTTSRPATTEPVANKPQYGRRLVLPLIEERARLNHKRPYASIPVSASIDDGFRDISYGVFANAINRCALWIIAQIGTTLNSETLVYLGPNDLRYQIFSMAALKTGHVMFFPSPRNSLEAFEALLAEAAASIIISDTSLTTTVNRIQTIRPMQHVLAPDLDHLLDESEVQMLDFNTDFDSYRFKPLVLLHTSGSTGLPKIVPIKHGHISSNDAYHLLEVNDVVLRYGTSRVFIPFPPFHIAGFFYTLPIMCWVDSTVVMPPLTPLNADVVNSVHTKGRVEYSMLAPSIIQDLAKDPGYLANLGRLNGLTFTGGPLSTDVAEVVSKKTSLSSSMGATEYGGIPMLPKDPEDWAYFKFYESIGGLVFRETDQPGIYEMVFVRDSKVELLQAIFVTFPDIDEYHTKDCFSKHPSKSGLWKYEGRLDDIIVFSNGEKISPVKMEGIIAGCPVVKGCLVVGQGRFQSALLLEPSDTNAPAETVLEKAWPYIQRANEGIGKFGRIARECILITSSDKPLARAPKGTVQRARSNQLYDAELEQLYRNLDMVNAKGNNAKLDMRTTTSMKSSLEAYICNELDIDGLASYEDFFSRGMDSLQLIGLVRALNIALGEFIVDQKLVYDNATIEKLTAAIHDGVDSEEYDDYQSDGEDEKETWLLMQKTYEEFSLSLPKTSKRARSRNFLKSEAPPPLFQPDGGTVAWLQVLGSLLININNWGLVNSFGVYQRFYEQELLRDYSASSISWIGTMQGALLLLVGVVSGPLFDQGYFRAILITASAGVVIGMMLLSLATEYYQILLSQGLLIGLCLGLLYVPSVALIPLYFKKHRGLALGIATAGGSLGGVIYPIVFQRILQERGFGWANRSIGFITLTTLSVAIVLINPVGARSTRRLFDGSAFRDIPYATFTIAGFFLFAGVLVPFFLTSTYANDALSADENLSSYTLAILNAAQFFGRILSALLSDYIGPELLLLGAELTAGLLGFAWIAVTSLGGYIAWLVVFGFTNGAIVTLPAAVLPWVSPSLAVIGTRFGMLYGIAGIGFLISTPVATALNRHTDGFVGAQVWTGTCCFTAVGFYVVTCLEARRMRRLYESRRERKKGNLTV